MKAKLSIFALLLSLCSWATVHNVSVNNPTFNPSSLTITQGDTVIWTNNSGSHNVNGTTATFPANPASFGNSVGTNWTYQYQFNTPGTYSYQCDPHAGAGMTGSITVNAAPATPDIVITGVFDGPLSGGTPKGVELYVINSIADLSVYGISSANNGQGSTVTPEFVFPNVSAAAGTFIYVASTSADFVSFFGFAPDYVDGSANINGDDAIELFYNGVVVDVFGDVNVDGTGTAWDYLDGWAYRVNNSGPDGSTFTIANWTFSGINNLENGSTNASCTAPFPIGTYQRATVNPPSGIPTYNISQLKGVDNNGVADSMMVEARIHGVVHSIDFDANNGYSFFIYDNTGGINIYSQNDVSNYTAPAVGDSIRVIGEVDQFRGLIELVPDSIVLLKSGSNLKNPMTTYAPSESNESDYIELKGFWVMNPSQWPGAGSSASVSITNGTDTTILRIHNATDIDGSPVPTAPFNVKGASTQFDSSSPYTDGYQIQPSSLMDFEARLPSSLPYYTIASVSGSDANTGVADSLNVKMELRGVVYTIDFDGNAGYSLYMYDQTGGMNVFKTSDVNNYTNPMMGDSISVFGEIDQFNGLTEIIPDSIVLWSRGVTLKSPMLVPTVDESTESEYIRLNGFTVVNPSQWPSAGSSASVNITDGTQTFVMRIDSDTDIDGTTAPAGVFDVIGAGGQFDGSSPFLSGYQIQPRSINDIIMAPPSNPTVNFAMSAVTGLESVGTIDVNLLINPVSSVQDTIFLQAIPGVNVSAADGVVSPTPDPVTGMFYLLVPANEDSATFTIQVIDDAVVESNETLFVNMTSVSAGLMMGANAAFQLVITDNDAPAPGIPTYDIAQLTTNDANGVADSLNVYAKINAVVFTDDFDGNAGYSFFVYDNTGGINIYSQVDVSNYNVERGDSLRLIGEIEQFNGLTELVVDSIVILDSNITLMSPMVVPTVDESTESEYVRLNGFTVVNPSQWPSAGSSANVNISDGTQTIVMRIDSDTDIDGSPVPTGTFDVIGAGGQFDGSNPYTAGYQIQPRDLADIIPVVVSSPTISFSSAGQSKLESNGATTISIPINPVASTAQTIKIYVANGAGMNSADYSLTPAASNDTITLTAAANASSVSFVINIVDDAVQESNEDISFTIARTIGGLNIGTPSTHVFTIIDNDTPVPTYDIAPLTTSDANGVADSVGVYARVHGIVFTPDFDFGSARTSFYIYDNTGGINIFDFSAANLNYTVTIGDSIAAIGTVTNYNGLTELVVDSIRLISSGNALKAPAVVNVPDESTESEYIRMNNVWLTTPSQWPTVPGGSSNVEITNGTDTTILRIDSDVTSLNGSPAPVGLFDVIGVGGQFDNSLPHTSGYQIMPRFIADIIIYVPKLAITEIMPSSNQPSPVNGDWFEVTNFGNDPIDMNGYSWDDDSQNPGTHAINSSFIVNPGESVIFLDAVAPDDSSWLYTWKQAANGLRVIAKADFGGIGFSNLGSAGDEVNLYDENGALIVRASYSGSDVTAGVSLQYDTTGTLLGISVNGVDGAYTSGTGDIGNPGNMSPISVEEFMAADFSLYPNPASDKLTLISEFIGEKQISINAVSGHLVKRLQAAGTEINIDLSQLAKGVYLITIEADGKFATRKLIID